jgi:DegV family protein with EDD domain
VKQAVAIASDSSVDLPAAEAARRGISIAPIQVAFSNEYFRDTALPRAELYKRLRNEPRLPTLAAALPKDFVDAYRDAAKRGEKILCLINPFESCSTYTSAFSATVALKKETDLKIEVMNTGRALTGLGAIAMAAADFAAKGAAIEEVIAAIEQATPSIDTYYAPATSKYLRLDGRISLYEMQVGSLEGMLPLIRVWGRVAVVEKHPTQEANINRMLERAREQLGGRSAVVVVTHAENQSGADELAKKARKQLDCRELLITELGPSAGSYCGEGTVGLGFCPTLTQLN